MPLRLATVQVHKYDDGGMAIFHGPHKVAESEATGELSAQAAEQAMGGAAQIRARRLDTRRG